MKDHLHSFQMRLISFVIIFAAAILVSCDDIGNDGGNASKEDIELAHALLKEIFPFNQGIPGLVCGLQFMLIEQTTTYFKQEYDFDNAPSKCIYKGKFQLEQGFNFAYRKQIYLDVVNESAETTIGGQIMIAPSNDAAPLKHITAEFTTVKQDVMRTHIIDSLLVFNSGGFLSYFGTQQTIFHFASGPNQTYFYNYQAVTIKNNCNYGSTGRITITSDLLSTPVEINFGDGICEKKVLIKINGHEIVDSME